MHRLHRTIGWRGGALLADAVGLGKTYVALALIEDRLRAGGDVVVVIPAALRGLWRPRLRRLGPGLPWRLVSHAQMSRGIAIRQPRGPRLVVVDEAHRFRNPATRRYGALARLLVPEPPDALEAGPGQRPQVLLVTATPINNASVDLYHLVRLFLPDDGLRDAGVPSLRGAFEAPDATSVRTVIRELVVRRSRGLVEARFGVTTTGSFGPEAVAKFPERATPRIHRYRSPAIPERVALIDSLELAAYGPGAAPLLRLALLKRLDSSTAALAVSVIRVREFLAAFRDAALAGRLLRPADRRVGGDGDPLQLLILGVVAEAAPPELALETLIAATDRDLARMDHLWDGTTETTTDDTADGTADGTADSRADPKARALAALLRSIHGEQVLVFTEYRDTAETLWRALLPDFRVARIDGGGAWLGGSPAGRRRVVERFAPVTNGRPAPPERERVDVLVATDVLAEGLNLQDARHVVSYDLPWNPVRLLQRIGRVDRLGSPHDVVVPHLFLPADGLDAVLGLTRRLRTKLHGIATALGEERADELLEGLASGRSERIDAALRASGRPEPLEELRTLWVKAAGRGDIPAGLTRTLAGAAGPPPLRAEIDPPESIDGALVSVVLVQAPDGGPGGLFEVTRTGAVRHPTRWTVRCLGDALSRQRPPAPGSTQTPGEEAEQRAAAVVDRIERHLRERRLVARAPAPLGRQRSAARLALRIRRLLASAGAGADPGAVRRAGAILEALARPLAPNREHALADLLRDDSDTSLDRDPEELGPLLDAAEAVLEVGSGPPAAPSGLGPLSPLESEPVRALLLIRRSPGGTRPAARLTIP